MEIVRLFEPQNIGKLIVPSRICMAAMASNFASELDGKVSKRHINYFVERAKGGVGLIITEATKVDTLEPFPVRFNLLTLHNDHHIPSFNELVESVHAYGAKIAVQLAPGIGRYGDTPSPELRPFSASSVPCALNPEVMTKELTIEQIGRIVKSCGEAAKRAKLAEFDAIEIHGHAGYLIDQFMTPLWNKRTDRYGGSLENRLRFAIEIVEAMKAEIGQDFPLIYRLSAEHKIPGGRELEESKVIAKRLEEAGVDALHIDVGCYEVMPDVIVTTYHAPGFMLDVAADIKKAVDIPVIAVGKMVDPILAEKALLEEKADFIALGKGLLADPEWPIKVKEGRFEDIRRCVGCLQGCWARHHYKYLSCAVNPAVGREEEYRITPTIKPKKVLIIGGGPAGMEAARVAALRGHDVTLFEKDAKLGGHLIEGSIPDFKEDYRHLLEWFTTQVNKVGVRVELGKEATVKTVEELKPDVVVVATGSTPLIPDIPGIEKPLVVTAIDVLFGRVEVKDDVIIAGGGLVGCETALFLSEKGKKATLVEMLPDIALDVIPLSRMALLPLLSNKGVEWLVNMEIAEVIDDGVIALDKEGVRHILKAGTVVLAAGMKSEREFYKALKGKAPEIFTIGDCVEPRKVINAVWEASSVARQI